MKTLVVFRKFGEDVVALLPEVPGDENGQLCTSYEHVGQHGDADYNWVMKKTKPAKPEDYADLMAEMKKLGYDLEVVDRVHPSVHYKREHAARLAS